jgi:hypothetical protein
MLLRAVNVKIALITMALAAPTFGGTGIDLHWLWDDRCVECHGHSGEFARNHLTLSKERLQGRHHIDNLRLFLRNHYLSDSEVDAVYNMLLAQASSQARFKDECSRCHDTAAEFVRQSLEFRDGALYGIESGRPIRHLLGGHSKVDPDDVEFYANLLTRVAGEVYRR